MPRATSASANWRGSAAERAFTFVEVTAALAILALALVVMLDGVRNGTMAFMRTREIARAQEVARRAMTEALINDEVPLDGEVNGCDLEADYPDFECEVHFDLNPTIQELMQLGTAAAAADGAQTINDLNQEKQKKGYFVVRVIVRWDDDGLEQEHELRSARLFDLEEDDL